MIKGRGYGPGLSLAARIQAFARLPHPSGLGRFDADSSAALVVSAIGFPRRASAARARISGSAAASRPLAAASSGTPVSVRNLSRVPGVTRPTPRALRQDQTVTPETPHQYCTAALLSICTARIRSPHKTAEARPDFFRRGHWIGAIVQPPTSTRPSTASSAHPDDTSGGWYGPNNRGGGVLPLGTHSLRQIVEH